MDNVPSTCIACDGVEDGELRCKGELPKSQSPRNLPACENPLELRQAEQYHIIILFNLAGMCSSELHSLYY
jgi:hypothetical protein